MAKDETTNKTVKRHFVPVPMSLVKRKTYQKLYTDWQADWNKAQTGTYTKKFFPEVTKNLLLENRYLYFFFTNHGPFQSYLYKIGTFHFVCAAKSLIHCTTCL